MQHHIRNILPGQRETPRPTPDALTADRPPRSLYIHIPFCFHKCDYCDFYSIVDNQGREDAFTHALTRDLQTIAPWAQRRPLRTIFIGGGTPTLLPVPLWRRLLDHITDVFDLSDGPEWTVECNPETATPELMRTLAHAGVNRISIGAQSFNTTHLETLSRWHDPESVPRAIALARDAGIPRISIDLIYAIPGQTLDDWKRDLDHALDLAVEHISAYSLTYEPGTAMTARLARGDFTPIDDDTDAEMMRTTRDILADAGYRRYEVSNYALPGVECRHNLAYWRQEPWLAAGPSAAAHIAGYRWKNIPHLGKYLENPARPAVIDLETPDPARALAERIMTGLRLAEGLDAAALLAACQNHRAARALRARVEQLRDRGLIAPRTTHHPERWTLTDEGMLLADRLAADLMHIVNP